MKQYILESTGFEEGHFSFIYIGVPITYVKLSKLNYKVLVDKMTAKLKMCPSRNMLYRENSAYKLSVDGNL